jgi:hypothetical protein
MEPYTIALFGEAEKGEYHSAYFCNELQQLVDYFGNAPVNSRGLHFAVQALIYHRNLLFFRVQEEGFSLQDYQFGVNLLLKQRIISKIAAIYMPGVGNREIIKAATSLCPIYHSIFITTETDFYDYITT